MYEHGRRVINPVRAHAALRTAPESLRTALFDDLSKRYFEGGEDIAQPDVLAQAFATYGLEPPEDEAMVTARGEVLDMHGDLDLILPSVPHFVLRDSRTGRGLHLDGALPVQQFERAITLMLGHAHDGSSDEPAIAPGARGMTPLPHEPGGMLIAGLDGVPVRLPHADVLSTISLSSLHEQRIALSTADAVGDDHPHDAPSAFAPSDFSRRDESDDQLKYAQPKLVHHLDQGARTALTSVYRAILSAQPPRAARALALLDLCSSWASHLPPTHLQGGARVTALGLNRAELDANVQATERVVSDLNRDASLPFAANGTYDVVTIALSIGYLTRPLEVLAEAWRVLRPGGVVVISYSNRIFAEKATYVPQSLKGNATPSAHRPALESRCAIGPCGSRRWKRMSSNSPIWSSVTSEPPRAGRL